MRIPGRFWWAEALVAGAVAVAALVGPGFYLNSQLPLDIELGLSLNTDLAIAAAVAVVALLVSLVLALTAARSLDGYRRRRRALRGDMEALPLAAALVPADDAPQQLDAPLVLHWRTRRSTALNATIYGAMALVIAVILGYMFVSYLSLSDMAQPASTSGAVLARALTVIVAVAASIICCVLGFIMARILWFQWRHTFGVTATADGLECVTETGRRADIPWSDARLLEVEQPASSALATQTWRLYGSREVVAWVYHPLSRSEIPDGVSAVETKLRQDALIRLIAARAGLAPRTLSKTLAATTSSARRQRQPTLALLLLTAITLALAVAVIVAPLTDALWLNVAFSLPLIVAVVLLMRGIRRVLRSLSQQSASQDVNRDSALIISLRDDSLRGRVYALRIRPSRRARVGSFVFGALLATELLPSIQSVLAPSGPGAPFSLHFSLTNTSSAPLFFLLANFLGSVLAWALCVYGVLGLMICFVSIYRAGTTLRADDIGLSTTTGTVTFTYPWSEMGELRESVEGGNVVSYTVHNRAGNTLFRWPAHVASAALFSGASDVEPISSAALARLVSQRIGGAER